jgi:reactive intermediate/imine deaminase
MFVKTVTAVFIICVSSGFFAEARADHHVSYIVSPETQKLNLPFSDAVRVNNMIYLSGQLGVEPGSFKLVPGGIESETRQIFKNMKNLLENNDSSLTNIVKCTVMMADISEWPKFNEIYVTYFPDNKPARSAFGANGLALGGRVEMECWAVVN